MALSQDEIRKLKRNDVLVVIKQGGKGGMHFVGRARVLGKGTIGCCLLGLTTLSKGDAHPATDGQRFKAFHTELSLPFE